MEDSKELQQEPISEKPSRPSVLTLFRRKLAGAARSAAKSLDETFAITNQRVPVEEINTQTVSEKILQNLGNPLQERLGGDRYANPFDITHVITQLGYVGMPSNTDYLKEFPGVYSATKQALWGLEQQGVLESEDLDTNLHGESKYYRVVNQDLLEQMASNTQEPQA